MTNTRNTLIKEVFGDSKIVLALNQLPNLPFQLTREKFTTSEQNQLNENGLSNSTDANYETFIFNCASLLLHLMYRMENQKSHIHKKCNLMQA